jgi:hypothetical protein
MAASEPPFPTRKRLQSKGITSRGFTMARMYPEDIEVCEKATDGEKRVFRFL